MYLADDALATEQVVAPDLLPASVAARSGQLEGWQDVEVAEELADGDSAVGDGRDRAGGLQWGRPTTLDELRTQSMTPSSSISCTSGNHGDTGVCDKQKASAHSTSDNTLPALSFMSAHHPICLVGGALRL